MLFSMVIKWSDEDECFISVCPEFGTGVSAHGKTPEKAARELSIAIGLVVESCIEDGLPIPKPEKLET